MAVENEASVTPASTQYETDMSQDAGGSRHSDLRHKKPDLKEVIPTKTPVLENTQSGDIEHTNEKHASRPWLRRLLKHWRHLLYAGIWLLFTGWWIAGLILHRHDLGWLIPFLLYLAITLRIIFIYVPITVVTAAMRWVWDRSAVPLVRVVPRIWRTPASALLVIAVILVGAFASPESADNTRANRAVSLVGLVLLITILYFTSKDRKRVDWHPVLVGMLVQFIIALFVLRTKAGYDIFNFISSLATDLLGFAKYGVEFLTATPLPSSISSWFLVTTIPAIIFFVSFVQLLYYMGVLQWFLAKFAVFFFWSMRVSGAEAIVAAASPFIGQGESAMLIQPFVEYLSLAEIHQVMCSGFATISGSVLIAYVAMGVDPQALVSACVMSIPASLAVSKLRWPEQEETLTSGRLVVPDNDEHRPTNALEAFTNGAWLGLKIAGMIGVSRENDDIFLVAQLIGMKLITNEFVAYNALQTDPIYTSLSPRSRIIVTYALCGFANIGSLGNQIGVLAQLAPGRTSDVSRVAFSALISGAFSTFTSASIAGMVIIDESNYALSLST